jgi:3-oxoacyl-[acyl-carrier protein] reductase
MCKEAIKVMNKGVIVNIASLDGIDTFSPYSMDYAASKAGVINITKNMASDVSNARIVALAPAWINTQTVLDMNPNYLKEEMKKHHQDKLLDKEKVALKIIEMIENDKYKTGSIIRMEDDSNE